jgi:uncharacterized protein with GYD domain
MGTYMLRASYSVAGIQGILKEGGSARRTAIEEVVKSLGGSTEALYWAFGSDDFVLIAQLPDNTVAAALASRVAASGVGSVTTTVLLSAEEIDAASAVNVNYRPPGA